MESLRRRGPVLMAVLVVVLAGLFGVDYLFFPYGRPPQGLSGDKGQNGLWLRDSWYFGKYEPQEARALATRLQENRVHWAYAHVRFIQKDGRLHFRHPENARRLVNGLRRDAPSVRTLAWVYVGNDRGITGVDISSTAVRRVMVEEARWLVNECAFDGIQWDYEICPDGDPDLLSLLQETRAALPPSKTLSVSTPLWAPSLPRRFGHGWSDEYFAKIAANCDQIVVMGYDSGIALPTAYAAFMRDQVTHVVRAASVSGNSECRVLIGVPTYAHGGLSHNARAENITTALRGVRAGYAKLSPGERIFFAGIAPFADYTTQDHEWTIYRRGWLNQPPRTNLSAW